MDAPVSHGALDHAELAARGLRPEELLDWSSNLNPFGPPSGVRAALAALDLAPYPDRSCLALRHMLAVQHGCALENVLTGNGSNELIHLIARACLRPGDLSLVIAPTFGEYAHASRLAEARITEWRARVEDDFEIDCAAIREQIRRTRPRLTWLCAPNNPTGVDVSLHDIFTLAETCAMYNGLLVVDRTYCAFVRGQEASIDQIQDVPSNTLLLHSLTKSYALAGLRVGYLLGDRSLLARISAYQPTWSVSSAAQVAGCAALSDRDFLPRTLPQHWTTSDELQADLTQMGLTVWRGVLPFLLVRTGDGAATRTALLERGCAVRDCTSFGLPAWVRIAPRRPEENARLLEVWEQVMRSA